MRRLFLPVAWCVAPATALVCLAAAARAEVFGLWAVPDDKAHVRISRCGAGLCGEIAWLKEPDDENGEPRHDRRNENESLRDRPILGLQLLGGFHPASETKWIDGTIYNPEDGKTYSARLELLDPATLKVSGCVFIFCRSQVWRRVE